MKEKLWVMYAVLTITTVAVGIISKSFPLTMGFAVAAAVAGWAAFMVDD